MCKGRVKGGDYTCIYKVNARSDFAGVEPGANIHDESSLIIRLWFMLGFIRLIFKDKPKNIIFVGPLVVGAGAMAPLDPLNPALGQ